jgi:hypothetical protein
MTMVPETDPEIVAVGTVGAVVPPSPPQPMMARESVKRSPATRTSFHDVDRHALMVDPPSRQDAPKNRGTSTEPSSVDRVANSFVIRRSGAAPPRILFEAIALNILQESRRLEAPGRPVHPSKRIHKVMGI